MSSYNEIVGQTKMSKTYHGRGQLSGFFFSSSIAPMGRHGVRAYGDCNS